MAAVKRSGAATAELLRAVKRLELRLNQRSHGTLHQRPDTPHSRSHSTCATRPPSEAAPVILFSSHSSSPNLQLHSTCVTHPGGKASPAHHSPSVSPCLQFPCTTLTQSQGDAAPILHSPSESPHLMFLPALLSRPQGSGALIHSYPSRCSLELSSPSSHLMPRACIHPASIRLQPPVSSLGLRLWPRDMDTGGFGHRLWPTRMGAVAHSTCSPRPSILLTARTCTSGAVGESPRSDSREGKGLRASPIEKILVANRGEIACRVMRTARRLGVKTVAVYSDIDRHAMHVSEADEAVRLGPALASKSYLNQEAVLGAMARTGAQAVHPGYGFLSENSGFASACAARGLEFIGPPAAAIEAMGDKSAAKELMTSAGVPVVPGYHGEDQSTERLEHEARLVGYPVLIKATQGGGGKGMRIVTGEKGLREGLEGAVREAVASFGNGRVLLERYIERPRHVEVQVFGDKHGNVVHLHERDCSVQRRHQKILEEAPAPGLSEELRRHLGQAAVDAARAVGYESAGTVEFIFDCDSGEFFFMEMNTRLQVEHPVTEMVVGQDLVEWQLRVANGEPLPLTQDSIPCAGHAFEARVYAENVPRGFLPSSGPLLHYRPPPEEPGVVRVESGVRPGDAISTFYDPLIAKLVVWGPDRASALERLRGALAAYQVAGLPTNLPLLGALAGHQAFADAELDTHFISRHRGALLPGEGFEEGGRSGNELLPGGASGQKPAVALTDGRPTTEMAAVAVGLCRCLVDRWQERVGSDGVESSDPWHQGSGFRVNYSHRARLVLSQGEEGDALPADGASPVVDVELEFLRDGSFGARVGDPVSGCHVVASGEITHLKRTQVPAGSEFGGANAVSADVTLFIDGWQRKGAFCQYTRGENVHLHLWFCAVGGHYHFTLPALEFLPPDLDDPDHDTAGALHGGAHGRGGVVAPMAGRVVRVCVEEGEAVQRGQPAVILESMKMEHTVRVPCTGKVVSVAVRPLQQVGDGSLLALVAPDEGGS